MAIARAGFVAVVATFVLGFSAPQQKTTRIVQPDDRKAEYEAECRRVLPTIRSGTQNEQSQRALEVLVSCPETGPTILAERWRSRPADSGYVRLLQEVSRNINDERIADEVLAIAEDRGAPEDLRTRALETLTTQLSPTLWVRMGPVIRVPGTNVRARSDVAVGSPSYYVVGDREVGIASRARIEQRLRTLADRDSTLASTIKGLLQMAQEWRERGG
jgi:hypothetical protein